MYSIIINSANRGKYLKGLLESLYNQTFKDFEVIVIGTKSNDNTEQVINEYKKKLDLNYIVYETNEKIINHAPISYNEAVKHAKYDRLVFCTSDIIVNAEALKNAHEMYYEHRVLHGSALQVRDESIIQDIIKTNTFKINDNPELLKYTSKQDAKAYFNVHSKHCQQPICYFSVFAKKLFNKIGGMDVRFRFLQASNDVDFGWRLGFAASQEIYIDNILCIHRPHPASPIIPDLYQKGIELREANKLKWQKTKDAFIQNENIDIKISKGKDDIQLSTDSSNTGELAYKQERRKPKNKNTGRK